MASSKTKVNHSEQLMQKVNRGVDVDYIRRVRASKDESIAHEAPPSRPTAVTEDTIRLDDNSSKYLTFLRALRERWGAQGNREEEPTDIPSEEEEEEARPARGTRRAVHAFFDDEAAESECDEMDVGEGEEVAELGGFISSASSSEEEEERDEVDEEGDDIGTAEDEDLTEIEEPEDEVPPEEYGNWRSGARVNPIRARIDSRQAAPAPRAPRLTSSRKVSSFVVDDHEEIERDNDGSNVLEKAELLLERRRRERQIPFGAIIPRAPVASSHLFMLHQSAETGHSFDCSPLKVEDPIRGVFTDCFASVAQMTQGEILASIRYWAGSKYDSKTYTARADALAGVAAVVEGEVMAAAPTAFEGGSEATRSGADLAETTIRVPKNFAMGRVPLDVAEQIHLRSYEMITNESAYDMRFGLLHEFAHPEKRQALYRSLRAAYHFVYQGHPIWLANHPPTYPFLFSIPRDALSRAVRMVVAYVIERLAAETSPAISRTAAHDKLLKDDPAYRDYMRFLNSFFGRNTAEVIDFDANDMRRLEIVEDALDNATLEYRVNQIQIPSPNLLTALYQVLVEFSFFHGKKGIELFEEFIAAKSENVVSFCQYVAAKPCTRMELNASFGRATKANIMMNTTHVDTLRMRAQVAVREFLISKGIRLPSAKNFQ